MQPVPENQCRTAVTVFSALCKINLKKKKKKDGALCTKNLPESLLREMVFIRDSEEQKEQTEKNKYDVSCNECKPQSHLFLLVLSGISHWLYSNSTKIRYKGVRDLH